MPGQNTMGGVTSDGYRSVHHMPHSMRKRLLCGVVVDGQVNADGRNDQLRHDSITGDVEHTLVLVVARGSIILVERVDHSRTTVAQMGVVCFRLRLFRGEIRGFQGSDRLLLSIAHSILRTLIKPVTDEWVAYQRKPR